MKLAVTLSPALIGHNTLSRPVIGCPGLSTSGLLTLHVNISNCLAFQVSWESYERLDKPDMWHMTTPPQARLHHTELRILPVIMTTPGRSDIMRRRSSQSCEIPLLSGGEQIKQWAQQGRRDKRNVLAERSTFLLLTYQWYLVSICLRKTPLLVRSCL